MLNNVPQAMNRMARNVIINHPNTVSCKVLRKLVTRAGVPVGGLRTLGGLGVLNSDDEESLDWEFIGNGYAMPAEPFSPSPMMDRQDANNGSGNEFRFLIEPEAAPGTPEWFDIKTHDVFYLLLGDAVELAFEVVGVETTINIPPYTTRYVANRRDDLHLIGV